VAQIIRTRRWVAALYCRISRAGARPSTRCLLSIPLALVWALVGCSSFCRDTLVSAHPSPDGRFVAVVFYRNCGATAFHNRDLHCSCRGGRDFARIRWQSISMADPEDSNKSLEHNGAIAVRLDWKTPQLLSISTPRLARVGNRVDRIGNIRIKYSNFD
jgi:hypothetical protein